MSQTSDICDVAVLGGGPAGCAAALTLGLHTGLRVAMIERHSSSEKPGEMLPPGLRPLLDYLQIPGSILAAAQCPAHGLQAAWGQATLVERPFLFSGAEPGWHLDRLRFERALRQLVQARGAVLHSANLRQIRREDGLWQLSLQDHAAEHTLQARFVIDASGRASRLTRSLGIPQRQSDRQIAIWRRIEWPAGAHEAGDRATLIEATPHGWWYSAGLPDGDLAMAFLTDADLARDLEAHRDWGWDRLLVQTTHSRDRAKTASGLGAPEVRKASVASPVKCHGPSWAACGDAALAPDPLSSMGISLALLTGAHAGRLAVAACAGQDLQECGYSTEINRLWREHQQLRKRFYAQETRWPEARFWARRQAAQAPDSHAA